MVGSKLEPTTKKSWRECCTQPDAFQKQNSSRSIELREKCLSAGPSARKRIADKIAKVSRPLQDQMMKDLSKSVQDASVSDPDMWEIVKPPLRRVIDMLFSDLEATLRLLEADMYAQAARSWEDAEQEQEHAHTMLSKQGKSPAFPFGTIRAWLLWHWVPFDKSVFGTLKDPIWIIMLILSLCAGWPRIIFCAVILICLLCGRAADEYQIVNFIILFKGTTFISSGLFTGVYAAVKYFWCVHPDGTHTCSGVPNADGPAVSVPLISSATDLIGSCVLVWTAYIFLPRTVHHGYAKFIEDGDLEKAALTEHGGHLRPLFVYDVLCFLCTALLFCYLAYHDATYSTKLETADLEDFSNITFDSSFQVLQNKAILLAQATDLHRPFFFGKLFYALLSAPFVIFKLPVLDVLLTHTQPTGFNKNGECVPFTQRTAATKAVAQE